MTIELTFEDGTVRVMDIPEIEDMDTLADNLGLLGSAIKKKSAQKKESQCQ